MQKSLDFKVPTTSLKNISASKQATDGPRIMSMGQTGLCYQLALVNSKAIQRHGTSPVE